MQRIMRLLDAGPLGRLLRSRYYIPGAVLTIVLLFGISGAQLLVRAGMMPMPFAAAHTGVTITGPGVPTEADTIQVYVLGAVVLPGVYLLSPDARVHDLITAAGGSTRDADLTRVSLAAPLNDGQSVYVPHTGETVPLLIGGKVALNVASEQDLRHALGISLDIARRIVAYRTAHGQFTAVSQLLLVPISRSTYDKIKDLVTV